MELDSRILTAGLEFTVPASGIAAASPVDGLNVQLKVEGVKNPNTMEETTSFALTTRTENREIIDETDTGFVVQITEAAEIEITSLMPSSIVVGADNTVQFTLQLPTIYQAGGWLTIEFPSTMSVDSNFFWCQLVIGFEEGEGCEVMEDGNTIKVTDTVKQTSLVFAIAGVKNPPNTMPTDTFIFRCYDPYGNEIGHSENQEPVIISPYPGSFP